MARRRRAASGDGSIYQRESDKRWVGSFQVGRKRKYVYGKTQKEAREKLRKAQQDHEQGKLVKASPQSLKVYLETWLQVEYMTLKPGSYDTYKRYCDRYILPTLGQSRLSNVSTEMIQDLLSKLLQERLAPATIRMTYAVLSSAFTAAVDDGKLVINPCGRVRLPRSVQHEMTVLDPVQARHLLNHIQGDSLEALITLGLATGMRKGEMLALRWEDINLDAGLLQVKKTVTYIRREGVYQFIETEPKTKAARRSITLPRFAIEALRSHRARQLEQRLKAGEAWKNKSLVFPNKLGGYMHIRTLGIDFHEIIEAAGLPDMRFHDLRHTCATILLLRGVHVKVVQELLGHSSIVITLSIYAHVLPSMQRAAMDELDGLFREGAG